MENGNFHLIFTRRCLRTFCSTLYYHAIFAGNDRRSSSMPLLGRLILHPSRNSGRSDLSAWTAREISSRSGLATLETIAIPDLSSYFTITVLPHGALRNYAHPSLFLVMLFSPFSRGRGLIRTLIRDDLSELDQARSTDARDPWSPEVTASSFSLLLFLLLPPETINLMGIYRRAKIPWAVVHPCQTVINVSKDRYLLWSRCSSFLPACSLIVSLSFPSSVSLLSILLRTRGGTVPSTSHPRVLLVFSPPPSPPLSSLSRSPLTFHPYTLLPFLLPS